MLHIQYTGENKVSVSTCVQEYNFVEVHYAEKRKNEQDTEQIGSGYDPHIRSVRNMVSL